MLENLPLYVQQRNIDEIRSVIKEAKAQKGKNWAEKLNYTIEDAVQDAVRDAILLKDRDIVQLFLDEGVSVNTHAHENCDSASVCPLIYFAAKVGSLPIVQLLVERGVKIKKKYRGDGDGNHRYAMKEAVEGGHVDVVRYLLQKGADPHKQYDIYHAPKTYLGQAALSGHFEIVKLLVSQGASVKLALHAIYSQHKKFCNYITENKNRGTPSINQETYDRCVLECRKYLQAVQLLLDFALGVDFTEDHSSFGYQGLCFLELLRVPGFDTILRLDFVGNLVGASINGDPITKEMLEARGFTELKNWLLTLSDIESLNTKRGLLLKKRLEDAMQAKGRIVSDEGIGIVNLVPLTAATAKGDYRTVEVRLANGESPNQEVAFLEGGSAIAYAARYGFEDIVQLLAKHSDIDQKSIVTAALLAKKHNHTAITTFLDSLRNVNEKDEKGNAPLHYAIREGNVEDVKNLIAKGANLSLKDSEDDLPLTIVVAPYYGIRLGRVPPKPEHFQILKLLLDNGANPNDSQYTPPLKRAVGNGSFEAVRTLLPLIDKKPLVRPGEGGEKILKPWYTGLVELALGLDSCWKELLDLFKEYDVEFNSIGSWRSFLLDKWEEFSLKKEKLSYLLQNGVSPDLRTSKGDTILHLFFEDCELTAEPEEMQWMVQQFFDHGLEVNAINQDGNTLLHEATRRGFLEIAAYLLDQGANINALNSNNRTPLHIAAEGRPTLTKFLVDKGADTALVDQDGLTPFNYSIKVCEDTDKFYRNHSEKRTRPFLEAQQYLIAGIAKKEN